MRIERGGIGAWHPPAHAPARRTRVKDPPGAPLTVRAFFCPGQQAPVQMIGRERREEETALATEVATTAKATAAERSQQA